jgi:hypothetical protein
VAAGVVVVQHLLRLQVQQVARAVEPVEMVQAARGIPQAQVLCKAMLVVLEA